MVLQPIEIVIGLWKMRFWPEYGTEKFMFLTMNMEWSGEGGINIESVYIVQKSYELSGLKTYSWWLQVLGVALYLCSPLINFWFLVWCNGSISCVHSRFSFYNTYNLKRPWKLWSSLTCYYEDGEWENFTNNQSKIPSSLLRKDQPLIMKLWVADGGFGGFGIIGYSCKED